MKKILLFSLLGLFALCATGCQSKEDTCCLVTISTNSDATIKSINLEKPDKYLGCTPGKYYIPHGKSVEIYFEIEYTQQYSWGSSKYTATGCIGVPVNQAKELDIKVGSYYKQEKDNPTPCVWVGGVRRD